MGDWFQAIVDRDISSPDAEPMAERIVGWLIGEKIIEENKTDCILGGDGFGYPPGPNYVQAVDGVCDYLLDMRTNGLEVVVERQIFVAPGQYALICDQCGDR